MRRKIRELSACVCVCNTYSLPLLPYLSLSFPPSLPLSSDTEDGNSPRELDIKPEPYSPHSTPTSSSSHTHRQSPYTVAINPPF